MKPNRISQTVMAMAFVLVAVACNQAPPQAEAPPAPTAEDRIARGAYLVTFGGCADCHTPGYFLGQPDAARRLAGSDVGFFMPGLGYVYGPNLTPDPATGIGNWTEEQIVTAIRTGVRPDGRMLAPIMPWPSFASLTDDDAMAIAAYLKSLAPIANQAPPLTGANQTPPAAYLNVMFPPGMQPPGPPPTP